MFFGALVDIHDAAGKIDLAMEEAKTRYGKLIWMLRLTGIPLGRIPGNV